MDPRLSQTLSRPDLYRLYIIENRLFATASQFGLTIKTSALTTYDYLKSQPIEKVDRIAREISDFTETLLTCAEEQIDPWNDHEFFRISMKRMGVQYPKDWFQHITDGDLVEAYDRNRFQIFRNLRFMETSSYSLLDILTFEWPVLFDRSYAITQALIHFCDVLVWEANRTIPFAIPQHYIRELRSVDKQVLQVNFKHLCPIFSGPNQPFGIIASCRASVVEASDPAGRLSFV